MTGVDPYTKETGASGYRNNPKNGRFCRCRILGSRLRRGPGPASAPGSLDWRRHPVSTCDTEKCPIARSWRGFYSVSFIAEGSCRVYGCWHRLNRPEYNLGLVEELASAECRLPESLHFTECDVILGVVRARSVHKIGYGHNRDWSAA